ncbi:MAG: energy transducer TonB, partial [Flavobacteriales bacterium]
IEDEVVEVVALERLYRPGDGGVQVIQLVFAVERVQYDGLVTVRYSLEGRKGRDLDVPGYTCEGGAQIDVAIVVAANGTVLEASLASGDPESCFGAAALRSARRARFNASSDAPKRQEGRLTYVFVAQ